MSSCIVIIASDHILDVRSINISDIISESIIISSMLPYDAPSSNCSSSQTFSVFQRELHKIIDIYVKFYDDFHVLFDPSNKPFLDHEQQTIAAILGSIYARTHTAAASVKSADTDSQHCVYM